MRAVVQRVTQADVTVEENVTGAIRQGLVVLLGVEDGDTEKDADYIAEKVAGLRISAAVSFPSHNLRCWAMCARASGRATVMRQDPRKQKHCMHISIKN